MTGLTLVAKTLANAGDFSEVIASISDLAANLKAEDKSVEVLQELVGVLKRYDEQSTATLGALNAFGQNARTLIDVLEAQNRHLENQAKAQKQMAEAASRSADAAVRTAKAQEQHTASFRAPRTIKFDGDEATIAKV